MDEMPRGQRNRSGRRLFTKVLCCGKWSPKTLCPDSPPPVELAGLIHQYIATPHASNVEASKMVPAGIRRAMPGHQNFWPGCCTCAHPLFSHMIIDHHELHASPDTQTKQTSELLLFLTKTDVAYRNSMERIIHAISANIHQPVATEDRQSRGVDRDDWRREIETIDVRAAP